METRKIAFACFVGGVLCCGVALLFAPFYWWLGLIAGFAGGYISYEFREVLRAIPIALAAAKKGSLNAWENVIVNAKAWLSQPHPFFYLGALLTLPLTILFGPYLFADMMKDTRTHVLSVSFTVLQLSFMYVQATIILGALFSIFTFIGARVVEKCYWVPTFEASGGDQQKWFKEMQEKGYREVPVTYSDIARWTAKGFVATLKFFVWTLWKYLVIGVWAMLCFSGCFLWHFFKLIHSEKRVLCAIDGTIGGAVSYIWLASPSMSFAQQVTLVIFGGFLGAAFGVVNWEIVSKRILHVVPANGT